MRKPGLRWVIVLALLVAALPRDLAAQPAARALALDWSAPPECPSRESVLSQVQGILGSSSAAQQPISATARVTRDGAQWHVDLATSTRSGTDRRSFDGDSCAAIAHAVAVIVALGAKKCASMAPGFSVTTACSCGP